MVVLPGHRIVPGSVIALTDAEGHRHRVLLPDDVRPGEPTAVRDGDLELVLRLPE